MQKYKQVDLYCDQYYSSVSFTLSFIYLFHKIYMIVYYSLGTIHESDNDYKQTDKIMDLFFIASQYFGKV